MKPEDIRKLVGGYATGTLTDQERRALMEAALLDQDLFDELARDQTLKDLLEDPQAHRRLLDSVEPRPSFAVLFITWLRRPLTWAAAGSLATAAVLLVVFMRQPEAASEPEPVLMAKRQELPELPAPVARPPAPARTIKEAPPAPAESKSVSVEKEKVEVAAEAAPVRMEMADRAQKTGPLAVGQVAVRASAARTAFRTAEADAAASPIPYRILRADASGEFKDTPAANGFAPSDRIRVIFEPAEAGHLRVLSSSAQVLLDREVESGTSVPLDVPPGEVQLTGTFRGRSLLIQIPRQPAP